MTALFAWATPAYWTRSPLDHTWITTYNSNVTRYDDIADVVAAHEDLWYCWGSFHAIGDPSAILASRTGNRALAECLVQPNADSSTTPAARGTIFTYGIDGVCHQLANQILYATGSPGNPPLTVRGARGYAISSFLFGTYGLQTSAWHTRLQGCMGRADPVSGLPTWSKQIMPDSPATPALPDDFRDHARDVLANDPEKLQALMALRGEIQAFISPRVPGFLPPDAEMLNARNRHMLEQAALLLGPAAFTELFGVEPGEPIPLVDPAMAAAQRPGDPQLR